MPSSVKPFKPKSKIWPYYEDVLDGIHVRCLVCKEKQDRNHQVKAPGGSTSSMIFHLKKHSPEFEKYQEETRIQELENKQKNDKRKNEELSHGIGVSSTSQSAKKQPKMLECVNKMMKYDLNGPKQSKFDEAVLELLAVNCLPFDLVNTPEWKSLVSVGQEDNCER